MASNPSLEPCIEQAVAKIQAYVKQVAGFEPRQAEIAEALQRYFVLKEINDHIVMARENRDQETDA